ncbi:hypothetical protein BP6252_01293 [Coleophoma cylindrospora]|uniref:DOMON domain-containing protein n=1 Tax=Coleophoma cylindrospora TaxID=1849047 RepID=A0A3D8SSW3_9HELO|nr:hypothetical protein BP6252_01293 [Coleophoma cylindrospora]
MQFNMRLLPALAALATTTQATVSYAPSGTSGPQFAVSIPQGTASSGSGDIYFQIQAPSSYAWASMGIGSAMAGASIFIMYADGNGNVTISGRNGGQGHVEPTLDSSLDLTLLAGSGISGGVMTANVLCTSCTGSSKLSSTTSTGSRWIAAWGQGNAIDSTSTSASVSQHDTSSYRQFSFDLTKAVVSQDTNPYVSTPSSSSATSSASASSPTSTSSGNNGNGGSGSGGSDSGSSSGSSSGASVIGSLAVIPSYQKAHGIIMGIAVVLLFPIGAMLMRTGLGLWTHGLVQILALALLLGGFGVGVKLADVTGLLYKSQGTTHTVFGTVLVALFLVQPFLGLIHHRAYVKTQARSAWGYAHAWFGRALIICAIVNGGLGLQLAANSTGGEIAWGVVSGIMFITYLAIMALTGRKKKVKEVGRHHI